MRTPIRQWLNSFYAWLPTIVMRYGWVLGLALIVWGTSRWASGLGEALLISWAVIRLIEDPRYTRFLDTLRQEVNASTNRITQASFVKLLGGGLPEAQVLAVQKEVFGEKISRSNLRWEVEIKPYEKSKNLVQLLATARLVATNLTDEPQNYEMGVQLFELWDELSAQSKLLSVRWRFENEMWESAGAAEFANPKYPRFLKTLQLKPKQSLIREMVFQKLLYCPYVDTFEAAALTDGITLQVRYPPDEIEVACSPDHHDGDKAFLQTRPDRDGVREWSIAAPLLPNEGLQLAWRWKGMAGPGEAHK